MQRQRAARPQTGGPAPAISAREQLKEAHTHLKAGRLAQARGLLEQVLGRHPKESGALFGLAQIAERIGELQQAEALLRRAIGVARNRSEYHAHLASVLYQLRRPEECLRSGRRAVSLNPRNAHAHYTIAMCHERENRLAEAIAAIEQALALAPHDTNAGVIRAVLHRRNGELSQARDRLERIVARETDPGVLAWPHHELGVVLDRLGRHDEAFEAFELSGAETGDSAEARRIDRDEPFRLIDEYKRGLTKDLLERWKPEMLRDGLPRPSFLVGFPRSGTTMTEQVMAAHPQIITASEEPLIPGVKGALARLAGEMRPVCEMLEQLEADQIMELRAGYWRAAEAAVGEEMGEKIFVDKLPLNIIEIGLINIVFPEARVIVALRDPRDVCLSCLMQWFQLNSAMINFLSLARTAEMYAKVMGFWLDVRDRLTLSHMQVRYEDTVGDLEGQAHRILEFLGAEWDDRVLQFHRQAEGRSIFTPSYEAVTETVHTRAVGRWRNYERHFEAVMPHLERFVKEFGYD